VSFPFTCCLSSDGQQRNMQPDVSMLMCSSDTAVGATRFAYALPVATVGLMRFVYSALIWFLMSSNRSSSSFVLYPDWS
jgi:hypothetical protein